MKFGGDGQATGWHRGKAPVSRVIAVQRTRCPTEILVVQAAFGTAALWWEVFVALRAEQFGQEARSAAKPGLAPSGG